MSLRVGAVGAACQRVNESPTHATAREDAQIAAAQLSGRR